MKRRNEMKRPIYLWIIPGVTVIIFLFCFFFVGGRNDTQVFPHLCIFFGFILAIAWWKCFQTELAYDKRWREIEYDVRGLFLELNERFSNNNLSFDEILKKSKAFLKEKAKFLVSNEETVINFTAYHQRLTKIFEKDFGGSFSSDVGLAVWSTMKSLAEEEIPGVEREAEKARKAYRKFFSLAKQLLGSSLDGGFGYGPSFAKECEVARCARNENWPPARRP
jgi:hypothetical protein